MKFKKFGSIIILCILASFSSFAEEGTSFYTELSKDRNASITVINELIAQGIDPAEEAQNFPLNIIEYAVKYCTEDVACAVIYYEKTQAEPEILNKCLSYVLSHKEEAPVSVVAALLSKGADRTITIEDKSALEFAKENNMPRIVELLTPPVQEAETVQNKQTATEE